jgi:putative ABC transport system ATP-binding protein
MPLLELQQIEKTYPSTPPVYALKDVNFSVEEGEFVSIVGPSGSGKSTLLNILGLLDLPTNGRYILDGEETQDLPLGKRTVLRGSKIGFVFQSFHLLTNKTVLENVALSGMYTGVSRSERLHFAREAIEKVGLEHRIDFSPNNLSGGEKQRVAVARAISGRPKLLLCDEPTGNLDSTTSAQIEDLLHKMNRLGLTIIVVTHNEDLARRGGRIIRVRDGEVSGG